MKMQCRLCGQILTDEAPPIEVVTRVAELAEARATAIAGGYAVDTPGPTIIDVVVKEHILGHARDQVAMVSP